MMKFVPIFLVAFTAAVAAGPYHPAAGQPGTNAVAKDDPGIFRWADAVVSYSAGEEVDAEWRVTSEALGPAEGNHEDIVCLGRGGRITLSFDPPIANGPGADIAVFENAISYTFLELAFVELSSDGVTYSRFPSASLTSFAVGPFGSVDPTNVDGLAGKYVQGHGTPFDFDDLPANPAVDRSAIRYVRIIDVVGGSNNDSSSRVIYDPFPTQSSAGFDLDAVAVLAPEPESGVVEIVSMRIVDDNFEITWASTPGVSYRIDASDQADGGWAPVVTVTAAASTHTLSFPLAGYATRFFRVARL